MGAGMLLPAIGGIVGSTVLGPAIGSVLGSAGVAEGLAGTIGGLAGGQAGSSLGQLLAGGQNKIPTSPELPSLAGLGQTMGRQGATSIPVPPAIRSTTNRPIGVSLPSPISTARIDPLDEIRRVLGV